MVRKIQDLTGKKFGRLIVIAQAESYRKPSGQVVTRWICRCKCGNKVIVRATNLKIGNTNSCGCLKSDVLRSNRVIHGLYNTKLYKTWSNMKQRCYNSNSDDYYNYGGRGITVCDEWLNSFQKFYNWSINNGYKEELTIDRINVNGNYEPIKCRWITNAEQQNNKRNNHLIEYDGKTQNIKSWCRELGLSQSTFYKRYGKGWSVQKCLFGNN